MHTSIKRYTTTERSNHWIVAIVFILAALSGLALFHPAFFFLVHLFGGGPWARILHPFIGVAMFVFFVVLAAGFWRLNRITPADRQWSKRMGDVMRNRDNNLPEPGKYNAGQKYLFWLMVASILLLLISGVAIWQPWFAPFLPVGLQRAAVVVHALAAWIIFIGIIVHIYAVIWVKGTLRAMTRGTVSGAWAKHHHRAWYREMTGK